MEPFYTPVIGFARSVFALQGLRFTCTGTENIPRTGGAVIAMNHIGYMDFAFCGLPAREAGRLVRFMAKKEVFDHGVSGPLMRGMKHIPVDRAAGGQAYQHAVDALRSGELVGVFPEATISRSFELKEFKSGAVRMAKEAGVPVVPMVLWGSQRVWTKDYPKRLGRTRTPISIDTGAPIVVPPDADVEETTRRLRETMAAMLGRVQQDYEPLIGADEVFLPTRLGGAAPTPDQARAMDEREQQERAARRAQA